MLNLIRVIRNRLARVTFKRRHNEIYDAAYYENIDASATSSREAMAEAIVRDLAPRNAVDIGCGSGTLLEALRNRRVQGVGLEYSTAALALCKRRRLSVYHFDIEHDCFPKALAKQDVAISFEVAEHLPDGMAERFVDMLTKASDTVVLSAATPGQGGTDHVNEQPHSYWIEKMARRGFALDESLTQRWREEWRGKTSFWYSDNVMIFRLEKLQSRAA